LFKSSSAGVTDRRETTTVNSFCAAKANGNSKSLLNQKALMELLLEQHSLAFVHVKTT
jgi:hypothetical protein